MKWITKATIKCHISVEDYGNDLYNCKSKYVTVFTIDSKKPHFDTREPYKIAIDPFDDKGIVMVYSGSIASDLDYLMVLIIKK